MELDALLKGDQVRAALIAPRIGGLYYQLPTLLPPLTWALPPGVTSAQLLPCVLNHEGRHLGWLDPTAPKSVPVRALTAYVARHRPPIAVLSRRSACLASPC